MSKLLFNNLTRDEVIRMAKVKAQHEAKKHKGKTIAIYDYIDGINELTTDYTSSGIAGTPLGFYNLGECGECTLKNIINNTKHAILSSRTGIDTVNGKRKPEFAWLPKSLEFKTAIADNSSKVNTKQAIVFLKGRKIYYITKEQAQQFQGQRLKTNQDCSEFQVILEW